MKQAEPGHEDLLRPTISFNSRFLGLTFFDDGASFICGTIKREVQNI